MSGSGIVLAPDGSRANSVPREEWGFPDKEDLPPGWRANVNIEELVAAYSLPKRKLRVILGIEEKRGACGPWIHLSVSHRSGVPTHATMAMCKKLFIGENREAIAIFPPASRHVNIKANCLHLWSPMDPRDRTWPKMEKMLADGSLSI